MLKKVISSILMIAVIASCMAGTTVSAETVFEIGDYVIIGTYNNAPLLWRYVADDDNGRLFVSDQVICFKRYSYPSEDDDIRRRINWEKNDYWAVASVRAWLNSFESGGNVVWINNNPPVLYQYGETSGYADEAGFLSNSNFSLSQTNLFKSTTQWTVVPSQHIGLSENELFQPYSAIKETVYGPGYHRDDGNISTVYYEIADFPSAYYGAAIQTTDKVFLLDELQLYAIWENFGTVNTTSTSEARTDESLSKGSGDYMLRGGFSAWNGEEYETNEAIYVRGIRPAFYLDESAIETMTGSGTKEDPYVLNARGDITVRLNGELLPSDQEPIIENGRTFVPFRAIFEALGAEVSWNGESQIATAKKEGLEIILQIGSNQMVVNGNVFFLDVAPRIVHNRTLVPVRAVFESLNATVDWDEELRQVIIITE